MKKDDIINISLDLFLEKGYEKTTITDIMRKSNLSKGGMYHHFSSKEDIFNAAVSKALDEEQVLFNEAVDETDSLEERLALLFTNASSSSEYLKGFNVFVQNEKNSLIFYRLRELSKKIGMQNLKRFLVEGIETGKLTFDVTFIDEISKIVYSYGEDMAFRALMVEDKRTFFREESTAFIYITNQLLKPTENFNEEFSKALMNKFK